VVGPKAGSIYKQSWFDEQAISNIPHGGRAKGHGWNSHRLSIGAWLQSFGLSRADTEIWRSERLACDRTWFSNLRVDPATPWIGF
jgi:hypothetical protein